MLHLRAHVLSLLTGCAAVVSPPNVGHTPIDPMTCPVGEIGTRFVPVVLGPMRPEERDVVREAMQLWEKGTGGRVKFVESEPPELRIDVVSTRDELPYLPDPNTVAYYDGADRRIAMWRNALSDDDQALVIAVHELGHFIGLTHRTYRLGEVSTMNASINILALHNRQIPLADRLAFCAANDCACPH